MSKAKAELDPAQEWQTTFDAMEDSICIIDLDSRILRCNKATERILGRPQNEIIGKFCYELVHNTDQPFENCPVVRMKSSRGRETMEFETEGRWLEVTVDPILDSEGNPTSAVHIIRDITDRKESEQTLQRSEASFRDIFDSASDMIGLQDIETMKFVYINKETERVTGQSLQEMNDRGVESFSPKDERYSIEKAAGYMQKALAGESQIFDWGLIDQDEKFHPTEVSLKRVTISGEDRLLSIARDITERKEAEDARLESEERFRNIFDNSVLGIYRTSADGEILMANSALLNMLGYASLEELQTRDLEAEGYDPDYPRSQFKVQIEKEGEVIGLESAWKRQDGTTLFVRENATGVRDQAGKLQYFEGTVENITQRKEVEVALAESEERFRNAFDNAAIGRAMANLSGTFTSVNPALAHILGYTHKELLKKTWMEITHPDDLASSGKLVERLLSGKVRSFRYEHRLVHKSGDPVWVDLNVVLVKDTEDQPLYMVGDIVDITERKKAQQALQESEAKFASAFHASPSLKTITRLKDGRIVDANESFIRISGHSREELIGSRTTELGLWADLADRERVMKAIKEKGRVSNLEIEFRTKSGELTTQLFSAEVVNLNDEPHLISVSNDITQRKRAQEELSIFRRFAEASSLAYGFAHLDGTIAYVNPALAKILGHDDTQKALATNVAEHYPKEMVKTLQNEILPLVMKEGSWTGELPLASSDGRVTQAIQNITLIQDEAGKPLYLGNIITDITQRKQMESTLQAEMQRSQRYLDIAGVMLVAIDADQKVTLINQKGCDILGHPEEEVMGRNWFDNFLPEDNRETVKGVFDQIIRGDIEPVEYFENEVVNKQGERRLMAWNNTMILDPEGNIIGTLSSGEDITERKLAEEALRESEARLSSFMDSASDSFYLLDPDLNFIEINQRGLDIIGKPKETVIGMNITDIVPEVKESGRYDRHMEVLRTGEPFVVEDFIPHPVFGDRHFVLQSFKAGENLGIIATDVTERMEAERSLKESEERYRTLAESSKDAIYVIAPEEGFQYINPAFQELLGFTMEEVAGEGFDFMELVHVEDRKLIEERTRARLEGHEVPPIYEFRVITKAGEVRHVEASTVSLPGTPILVQGQLRDITDRKKAETRLKQAFEETKQRQQEVSALLTSSRAVMESHDFETAARKIFDTCTGLIGAVSGYVALISDDGEENEVLFLEAGGLPCDVDPELPMPIRGLRAEAYHSGKVVFDNDFNDSEWMEFMPAGHVTLENVLFAPLMVRGRAIGLMGMANKPGGFTDYDARMAEAFGELAAIALRNTRDEEALRDSEEKLRTVIDHSSEVYYIHGLDQKLTYVSEGCKEVFGFTPKEMLVEWTTLVTDHPLNEEGYKVTMKAIETGEAQPPYILEARRKDDDAIFIEVNESPIKDDQGQVIGISGAIRDVTERRLAESRLREHERMLSDILEVTLSGYWDWNIPEHAEYLSPAFKKMFGFEDHELPNSPDTWQELIFPDDLTGVLEVFDRHVESHGKVPFYNEVRYRHRNGSTIWVICAGRVVEWADDGSPIRMIGCHIDITELKRAEEALKESEEKYRILVENANEAISVLDGDLRFQLMNLSAARLLGGSPSEFIGKDLHDILPPDEADNRATRVREVLRTGEGYTREIELPLPVGIRWFQTSLQPIVDDDGNTVSVLNMSVDITERKEAEAALKESLETSDNIVRSSPIGLFIYEYREPDTLIMQDGNQASCDLTGINAQDWVGREFDEVWPVARGIGFTEALLKVMRTGQMYDTESLEYTDERLSGAFRIRAFSIPGQRLIVAFENITERKQAEAALKESETRFRALFETSPDAVLIDQKGLLLYANPAYQRIFGIEDLETRLGRPYDPIVAPEDLERVKSISTDREAGKEVPTTYEFTGMKEDGTHVPVEVTAARFIYHDQPAVMAIIRDISERKEMEQKLIQHERLAGIGQLAAGVAHEINTPLSNISLMADNLREETEDPIVIDYAAKTLGQVEFAAIIVRELLQFARPDTTEFETLDLNEVVESGMAQLPIPERVTVDTRFARGTLPIRGDRFQLHEVITNLLSNAVDAIDKDGDGQVTVRTSRTRKGVRLTLSDDGCGIPEEHMPRVFEPFYTTKPTGQGTGLGLSLVYRYVEAHQGKIKIRSEVNEGTTVTIDLELDRPKASVGDAGDKAEAGVEADDVVPTAPADTAGTADSADPQEEVEQ